MDALNFTRREVEALARNLDSPHHELSLDERALLVAVFAAAKHYVIRIQPISSGESGPTPAELKEQLLKAFLPAEGDEFAIRFHGITGDPDGIA